MNRFKKQNYYERLEIPLAASPFEINHAYRMALQIYNDESLASYSFFSEAQRKEILSLLEEAFLNLINEQSRHEYDQGLIEKGVLKESSRYKRSMKDHLSVLKQTNSKPGTPMTPHQPSLENNPIMKDILAQDVLTGEDLRKIRLELGLSLDQISDRIKVRTGLLQSIEEDRFDQMPSRLHLKSFLTQYVQCLRIDTDTVVTRYLKRFDD
jgi:hypothetical protein